MPTTEARVVGAEEKSGGYVRFETDGRPRYLDTKREELIEEGYRLLDSGSVVVMRYSEAESRNTNPNTGQPYTNRYFEGAVTDGRERGQEADVRTRRRPPEPERREREPERRREPEQRGEPQMPNVYGYQTHPVNAWRMALTSGSERAVQTLPLMPSEQRDFDTQKAIALAWANFIMNTPKGSGEEARATSSRPAPGAYDEPDYDSPPPHGDEDIPF